MLVVSLGRSELGFENLQHLVRFGHADVADDLSDLRFDKLDVGLGFFPLRGELQELFLHPLLEL